MILKKIESSKMNKKNQYFYHIILAYTFTDSIAKNLQAIMKYAYQNQISSKCQSIHLTKN